MQYTIYHQKYIQRKIIASLVADGFSDFRIPTFLEKNRVYSYFCCREVIAYNWDQTFSSKQSPPFAEVFALSLLKKIISNVRAKYVQNRCSFSSKHKNSERIQTWRLKSLQCLTNILTRPNGCDFTPKEPKSRHSGAFVLRPGAAFRTYSHVFVYKWL